MGGLLAALAVGLFTPAVQAQTTLTTTRTSSFTYYAAADGAKNGLLKTETIEPDQATYRVDTTYTYDAYGNRTSATTANGVGATGLAVFASRTSGNTYANQTVQVNSINVPSPTGLFATGSTNALNQSETHQFDPRFGAMTQLTGPNGLATTWTLDAFGRQVKEQRADGTSTLTYYCVINKAYPGGGTPDVSANTAGCLTPVNGEVPSDAFSFVQTVAMSGSTQVGPYSRVYSDRLGRTIRGVTQSFDGSAQTASYKGAPNGVQNRATFDAATGRTTSLTAGTGTSTAVLNQTYTWDSLNNLTSRADANGDGSTGAVSETFTYADQLNRLTGYTVAAPAIPGYARSVSLQYNALGMLLYKSDVGNYAYPSQGTAHAYIGCVSSVAGGGSCRSGAIAAAASAGWGNYGPGYASGPGMDIVIENTIQAATIGGVASVASGGSFSQGAQSAAFEYLFNELQHYQGTAQERYAMAGYNGYALDYNGETAIQRYEGLRLWVYEDTAGNPTVGWGHMVIFGDGLNFGDGIILGRASYYFDQDTGAAVAAANRLIPFGSTQGQFDAAVSLIYNIGANAFAHSQVLQQWRSGNFDSMSSQWLDWNHSGGSVSNGLSQRRAGELVMFYGKGS